MLQDELLREDKLFNADDITALLEEDSTKDDANPRPSIIGYPTRPLCRELGVRIQQWAVCSKCPVVDLPTFDLLDEKDYVTNRWVDDLYNSSWSFQTKCKYEMLWHLFSAILIAQITPKLESINSLWSMLGEDERKFHLREILLVRQSIMWI